MAERNDVSSHVRHEIGRLSLEHVCLAVEHQAVMHINNSPAFWQQVWLRANYRYLVSYGIYPHEE